MTEQNPQTDNLKKRRSILWLVVILLIILVAATVAAASGVFSRLTSQEDTVISLEKGSVDAKDQAAGDQNQDADSDTVQDTDGEAAAGNDTGIRTQNAQTGRSSVHSTGGKTTPAKAKSFGFQVSDDKQVWSTDTQIDIFHASYDNETGEITVQSVAEAAGTDGTGSTDKLIAPGTGNEYTFALQNTGQKKADYKLWVEARISDNVKTLPLQTRMGGKNGWLAGGADQWLGALGLDGVSETGQLAPGRSSAYTIYWQWPFEQGDDAYDTWLGNLAAAEDVTYTITIHTLASDAEASDAGGNGAADKGKNGGLFRTGDDSRIWIAAIVLFAAGAVAVILWIRRKKERSDA